MASIVTQQLLKQIVSKQTLVAASNVASNAASNATLNDSSNIEIKIDSLNLQGCKDVILEESKNHIVKNDISGRDWKKISELVASSLTKKWIKPIMACDTIIFTEYNRKDCFKLVANVELDTEINTTGKKKDAKKRNTLIRFIPTIELADYKNITEWLYIFTINDRIIKMQNAGIQYFKDVMYSDYTNLGCGMYKDLGTVCYGFSGKIMEHLINLQ